MANMTPFGYGALNPEDQDYLEQMIRRVNMAGSDPASAKAGDEMMPFGGMGIAVQDMPKGQARLPNGETPSTTPYRNAVDARQPLEQGATPQKMSVPQTAPIIQQQRQPMAGPPSEANPKPSGAPMHGANVYRERPALTDGAQRVAAGASSGAKPMAEPNFWDRLGAFSQGYNKGGLVGAVAAGMGTGLDREVEGQNMTLDALVKAGIDPTLASAAIRNPDLMKVLLQYQAGRATPDIKTIKTKDKYGRETEVPVTYNPSTRQWERVTIGGEPNSAPAVSSPAAAPTAPAGNGGGAPALPAPMSSMASGPAQAAPAPALTPSSETNPIPPGWRENRAVPLSSLPDPKGGYSYDAPNGYPLEDANGNLKLIPSSELAARAKANEKRAEAQVESEQQRAGVMNIINTGRSLIEQPGFDAALRLNRADVGNVPIPYSGGEGISAAKAGYALSRATDPQNPVWGVKDDINAIQNRLKAIVARPLFKGQGQVSDSERRMIAEMIGDLDKATSRADFLFRMNSIEGMIEDVYAGKKLGPKDAYLVRPKTEELRDIYNSPTPEIIEQKVQQLAQRYRLPPDVMKDHVRKAFDTVGTGKPGAQPAQPEQGQPWYNRFPFYIPQLDVRNYLGGGGAPAAPQAAPRGIPDQAPPGARELPPGSGYPPGSKASRDPNNPNRWIIWTPE